MGIKTIFDSVVASFNVLNPDDSGALATMGVCLNEHHPEEINFHYFKIAFVTVLKLIGRYPTKPALTQTIGDFDVNNPTDQMRVLVGLAYDNLRGAAIASSGRTLGQDQQARLTELRPIVEKGWRLLDNGAYYSLFKTHLNQYRENGNTTAHPAHYILPDGFEAVEAIESIDHELDKEAFRLIFESVTTSSVSDNPPNIASNRTSVAPIRLDQLSATARDKFYDVSKGRYDTQANSSRASFNTTSSHGFRHQNSNSPIHSRNRAPPSPSSGISIPSNAQVSPSSKGSDAAFWRKPINPSQTPGATQTTGTEVNSSPS